MPSSNNLTIQNYSMKFSHFLTSCILTATVYGQKMDSNPTVTLAPKATETGSSTSVSSATTVTLAPMVTFPAPTGAVPEDMQDILNQHNKYRALHQNTAPLAWSPALADHAREYMESLIGSEFDPCSGKLQHSSNRPNIGENLAWGTASNIDLINAWYDEIKYYNYSSPLDVSVEDKEVGHFTQLVWAATTEVGCATVQCSVEGFVQAPNFLICQYSSVGNQIGLLPDGTESAYFYELNVHPLISA